MSTPKQISNTLSRRGNQKGSEIMKTETPTEALTELCLVCDRVAFGDIVRLGFGKWRHDSCYGGSPSWLENFYRIKSPTSEQVILYNTLKPKERN